MNKTHCGEHYDNRLVIRWRNDNFNSKILPFPKNKKLFESTSTGGKCFWKTWHFLWSQILNYQQITKTEPDLLLFFCQTGFILENGIWLLEVVLNSIQELGLFLSWSAQKIASNTLAGVANQ